jgi:hypothetical protein
MSVQRAATPALALSPHQGCCFLVGLIWQLRAALDERATPGSHGVKRTGGIPILPIMASVCEGQIEFSADPRERDIDTHKPPGGGRAKLFSYSNTELGAFLESRRGPAVGGLDGLQDIATIRSPRGRPRRTRATHAHMWRPNDWGLGRAAAVWPRKAVSISSYEGQSSSLWWP